MCLCVCVRVCTCVQGPSPGRRLQVMQKYEHTKMKSGLAQLKCKVQLGKDEMSWRAGAVNVALNLLFILWAPGSHLAKISPKGLIRFIRKSFFSGTSGENRLKGKQGTR